jgi:acyl-CoA thioesterase FadM
MELNQTVKRSGEALFEAQVTVVLVDGKGKPKRLPPEMTKTFLSLVESAT